MPKLGMMRQRRKGIPVFVPPAGNVVSNWAGSGTGGANGLPTGWFAQTPAGVTLSVLSRTAYRGGTVVEVQFAGTATAAGNCIIQPNDNASAACAAGQTWRWRLFVEPVGTPSPAAMTGRLSWRDGALAFLGTSTGAPLTGTVTGMAIGETATAPTSAAYVWFHLVLAVSSGQAVNLRYKLFAPTLARIS